MLQFYLKTVRTEAGSLQTLQSLVHAGPLALTESAMLAFFSLLCMLSSVLPQYLRT